MRKVTPPDDNELYAMKVLRKATLKGTHTHSGIETYTIMGNDTVATLSWGGKHVVKFLGGKHVMFLGGKHVVMFLGW